MLEDTFKTALHAPPHLFRANAVYVLTAATYRKRPLLQDDERKEQWLNSFRRAAQIHDWAIVAWVVLANHYHVIVRAPTHSADNLPEFVASYHKFTARRWNQEEGQTGRQVWWNYWDTCVRQEKDYLTRLNYVHWNPVKHGVVSCPEDYSFSSYRELLAAQADELRRIEVSYPFTNVEDVPDDF